MPRSIRPVSCRNPYRPMTCFCRRLLFILVFFPLVTACQTTSNHTGGDAAATKRMIGEANLMQGNYTVALKELLEAEKLAPNDPVIHNYLGITYKNKQMPEKAIEHFNKALQLNPEYSIARNNLGTVYLDKGQYDTAIDHFKSVANDILYMTPHYPLANLGWASYKKGDYATAKSYFTQALDIQPEFLVALNGLGQTHLTLREYSQAIIVYEKIIKKAPRVPEFLLNLARAYEFGGNPQKAATTLSRYLLAKPHDPKEPEIRAKIKALSQIQ
ncbi:MAG: tetratricopeptide repeat protein [Desulfobacterales bacterium]